MPSDIHTRECPTPAEPHTDEAKRLSDQYRLHRLADPIGSIDHWFAVRLDDGRSNGELYPDKATAELHNPGFPYAHAYVHIVPSDMPVCQAEIWLRIQRVYHRKGFKSPDPQPIPRLLVEDMESQMRALMHGGKPSNLIYPPHGKV